MPPSRSYQWNENAVATEYSLDGKVVRRYIDALVTPQGIPSWNKLQRRRFWRQKLQKMQALAPLVSAAPTTGSDSLNSHTKGIEASIKQNPDDVLSSIKHDFMDTDMSEVKREFTDEGTLTDPTYSWSRGTSTDPTYSWSRGTNTDEPDLTISTIVNATGDILAPDNQAIEIPAITVVPPLYSPVEPHPVVLNNVDNAFVNGLLRMPALAGDQGLRALEAGVPQGLIAGAIDQDMIEAPPHHGWVALNDPVAAQPYHGWVALNDQPQPAQIEAPPQRAQIEAPPQRAQIEAPPHHGWVALNDTTPEDAMFRARIADAGRLLAAGGPIELEPNGGPPRILVPGPSQDDALNAAVAPAISAAVRAATHARRAVINARRRATRAARSAMRTGSRAPPPSHGIRAHGLGVTPDLEREAETVDAILEGEGRFEEDVSDEARTWRILAGPSYREIARQREGYVRTPNEQGARPKTPRRHTLAEHNPSEEGARGTKRSHRASETSHVGRHNAAVHRPSMAPPQPRKRTRRQSAAQGTSPSVDTRPNLLPSQISYSERRRRAGI